MSGSDLTRFCQRAGQRRVVCGAGAAHSRCRGAAYEKRRVNEETTMEPIGIVLWLVIGAIAGWIAGNLMKGGGFGLIGNIIVGIVGRADRRLRVRSPRHHRRRLDRIADHGRGRCLRAPVHRGPGQARLSRSARPVACRPILAGIALAAVRAPAGAAGDPKRLHGALSPSRLWLTWPLGSPVVRQLEPDFAACRRQDSDTEDLKPTAPRAGHSAATAGARSMSRSSATGTGFWMMSSTGQWALTALRSTSSCSSLAVDSSRTVPVTFW